jgi:hypothetical protein
LTKLYKLLSEGMDKSDTDVIQLFSNYSAGELDKPALIRQVRQKQLARNVAKGKATGKMWWKVSNPANSFSSIEVVASSKEEAIDIAVQPSNYPDWARAKNTLRAIPLRPYEAPSAQGNWGIWLDGADRFVRIPRGEDGGNGQALRRFSSQAAAMAFLERTREENPQMRTDISIREIPADYQWPPAADAASTQASSTGNWRIKDGLGRVIYTFRPRENTRAAATAIAAEWTGENNFDGNYTVVPSDDTPADAAASTQTPAVPQGGNTGDWGVWVPTLNHFVTIGSAGQRRFDTEADAQAWIQDYNTRHPNNDLELIAREVAVQPQEYEVFDRDTGATVDTFGAFTDAEVARGIDNYRTMGPHNLTPQQAQQRYGLRRAGSTPIARQPQFQEPDASRGNLTPRGPGPWEIYRISDGSMVRVLDQTNRQGAETEARTALGLRGEAPELYAVRTRQSDAAQGGVVDVAGEQPAAPQAQQEWTGEWKIVDANDREIHRFGGVGNVQADDNRIAIDWLRQNPRHMQSGVQVLPVMG